MAQSIYKNALFKGVLSFFNIIIPLLIIPYVYRVLAPASIGYVEYGNSIYTYFYIFGSLGIYGYGVREISKARSNPALVKKIYHNLFGIGVISNVIAFVFFLAFILFGVNNANLKIVLFIFSIGIIGNGLYTEWINEAFEDFVFITAKTIIVRIISVFAIFILVKDKEDLFAYVLITVLVIIINNFISFIYAKKYTHYSFSLFDLEWRLYLPPLFFIFILNNSNILYTTLDKTMLGAYSSVENVAFYSIGQKIMDIIRGLLLTGIFVSMPRLSFYLSSNYERYLYGLERITRITLFLVIPISILLILLSEEIVRVFAGLQYMNAVLPLQIFALRIVILSVESIVAQQVLFLNGKEKVILAINLIFGFFNMFICFLFLNKLNPEFAIAKTLIVETLLVLCELYYVKKYLGIQIRVFSYPILFYFILSLLFIPVVIIVRDNICNMISMLMISSLSCGLIYIIGAYILKDSLVLDLKMQIANFIKHKL